MDQGKIAGRKKGSDHSAVISLHDFPDDRGFTAQELALLEKLRACEDIVHDWDDPGDFSMWNKVFAEALAP